MSWIYARKALLESGWRDGVRIGVDDGRIVSVAAEAASEPGDTPVGFAIPGLANAHSHAFQRALAGRGEVRSPKGRDSFWTWREAMYALTGRLDAAALEAIACQAYNEMLASGYTCVAEFHYLHSSTAGDDADGLFAAIAAAAARSGIRLVYVPVLYERGGFEATQAEGPQALFASTVEAFLEHRARAGERVNALQSVGIGAHSLRAVSRASLARIAEVAAEEGVPMHLHVAEQQREVEQCISAYGQRPVEWLLDTFDVGGNWCLVHATHIDAEETKRLARSGAVVCLCPSTEANLGDGLFPLPDYLGQGGSIAIGSDSQVTIDPYEELRWLEYGQRLATRSRNVASMRDPHVGRELYLRALEGGARACRQDRPGLRAGGFADLVALDDGDPMFAGHDDASLLDALVFGGYRMPIERVMVHGEWRVVDGEHVDRASTAAGFAAAIERIGAAR